MGDASDSLFCRPAIKRLKAVTPEHDFTIEFAYHRWHLIQGMREYFELVRFRLELRFCVPPARNVLRDLRRTNNAPYLVMDR